MEPSTSPLHESERLGSPPSSPAPTTDSIQITLHHHGQPYCFEFAQGATLLDLSDAVADALSVPPSHQKFLVSPRVGMLKPPFAEDSTRLSSFVDKKINLMGSTLAEIASIDAGLAKVKTRSMQSSGKLGGLIKAYKYRDRTKEHEEALYSFAALRPLHYLPNPDKSLKFLERLSTDPGIKASMRKHRWSVGLLTEMDPASHTSQDSRTLGLNRNRGEVIELRLRTDAYDGYRNYNVIRKTLCHELTHNVFGEHDRDFWDLCKQVEKEVEAADWKGSGRTVGSEEYREVADEDEHVDGGGWTGGEYVLGGDVDDRSEQLSRREILARAAEARALAMLQQKDAANRARRGGS